MMDDKQTHDLGLKMDELLEKARWVLLVHDDANGETNIISNVPKCLLHGILFRNATKLRREVHQSGNREDE